MLARSMTRVVALGAVAVLSLAACANNAETPGGEAGAKEVIVSSDLPLQGASASTSESTNNMIELYLESIGNKVGDYTIKFQTYDDSTAAKGAWDDAACAKNATDHVANEAEVAVMGTFNSGCAKIQVPTLNQDSTGPMLMVSHANTNPGLTKAWETGEPDKYFPTGTRNYARVVTTDDYQGQGAAQFAFDDLKVKKAFVLNDNQTYGIGVAKAFADVGQEAGHRDRRRAGLGRQAAQLHRPLPGREGLGRGPGLPGRHLRQQRRPADQGQGRRARCQRR